MKIKKIKNGIKMLVLLAVMSILSASAIASKVPGVPRGFHVTSGDGSVYFAWSEPANDGGSIITGYRIYRGIMEDELSILEDVNTVDMYYTDTGLQNGQTYYYAVSALNSEGEGEKTEVLQVTPESTAPLMQEIILVDWINNYEIYVGEGVYFNLAGGTQTMIVESVTPTSAIISVSWDTEPLIISEGDSKNIDVNNDGKDDFKLTCKTITSNPVGGFPQTVKFSSTTKNIGGSSENGTPGFELWTLLVAGIVVFSIAYISRRRR